MRLSFQRDWVLQLDEVVGNGGFGKVVAASDGNEYRAVAKLVPKAQGASRELLAVSLPSSDHLVPIVDFGEFEDKWVLIMPRADYSLRDRMSSRAFDTEEALDVLSQIAEALAVLDGAVVHRDLKPENVLMLNGKWAICDFGIARYAEATTSVETHKYSMSAPYAAPEQWRMERATPATDVYALGIIGYELFAGTRPFSGPSVEEFREQHLHQAMPPLGVSARVSSLISECLFKSSGSRPGAVNLIARLSRARTESARPGALRLAEAQRFVRERNAEQERLNAAAQSESSRRAELYTTSIVIHSAIVGELKEAVLEEAPAAELHRQGADEVVRLGSGTLRVSGVSQVGPSAWSGYPVALDVIASAELTVTQPAGTSGYEGRSHSLYYCDFEVAGQYEWFEIAFMPTMSGGGSITPFALRLGAEAGEALSRTLGMLQLARPFVPIRQGELDEFLDRWLSYLGQAASAELRYPSSLPEGVPVLPRQAAIS